MSCTHDCGCTPEIRDARTDEWVQIAPESARPATLAPEQPVKAPGQVGDIFLARGTAVEADWSIRSRSTVYVDEGGYQLVAGKVGNGKPYPWGTSRIVRVFTVDKPAPEPVDPDAELVERMAKEVHDRNCADVGCRDWDGHGESTRKAWRDDARVVIRNLRAKGFDVTPRADR